jgi:hypothetical protein
MTEAGLSVRGGKVRFLYFYLISDPAARVNAVAPKHALYWRELGLPHYLVGPSGTDLEG